MSYFSNWLWGASQLEGAIDKATSELLPAGAEDMALNLEICDQIRSKSVSAKDAMRSLKRRLNHKNPNVQLLALGLTDVCVKNGGDLFLAEIASREFMDNLVSLLKVPSIPMSVMDAILKHIQNWSLAFEGKPALNYVGQVYKTLKNEGYKFPPTDMALANSAMVDTQTAPEWIDSDLCLRCRTPFSFTNRKHHCRNCGQVFDQQCSSKSMPLPHFGITQDVRVCDGCHSKLSKKAERPRGPDKHHHRHHSLGHEPRRRSGREQHGDAELQRAIQLSLKESGSAGGSARPGYVPSHPPLKASWDTHRRSRSRSTAADGEEDDPDLRAAIEASLREANAPRPSAPEADTPTSESPGTERGFVQGYGAPPGGVPAAPLPKLPNYDLDPLETDAILTFSQTVEHVQAQGGRDMSRYPAVNELYDKASSLRPKLALSLDDTGRKEHMLAEMHDKLSQAVKLYDKLLMEQVSHPTWRMHQQQQQQASPAPVGISALQAPTEQQRLGHPQTVNRYAPMQTTPTASYSAPPLSPQAMLTPLSHQTVYAPVASLSHPPVPLAPPQFAPNVPQQSFRPPSVVHAPSGLSTTLARHNTLNPSAASHASGHALLSRHNTIGSAPASAPLPNFPVAPTSTPTQGWPSMPVTRQERKEMLLIDL